MTRDGFEVEVATLPACDMKHESPTLAHYDARMVQTGVWANLCEEHFAQYGAGLGVGTGQRLICVGEGEKPEPNTQQPDMEDLISQVMDDGPFTCTDGCEVYEPDGVCEHRKDTWLRVCGLV